MDSSGEDVLDRPTNIPPSTPPGESRGRLAGLDGIRGVAALFVMVHHCWLLSFPGYPAATGPGWLHWLLYGHFAVVGNCSAGTACTEWTAAPISTSSATR